MIRLTIITNKEIITMQKSRASGLIYIIIGIVILIAVFPIFENKNQKNLPLVTEVTNELKTIHTLEIESTVSAINITESHDELFHATLNQSSSNNSRSLTLVSESDNNLLTLQVENQKSRKVSLISNLDSNLTIKIPKHFNGTLDIVTTTGKTQINNLNLKTIDIETTTGGIKLNNVNVDEIELESTTGSIEVSEVVANRLIAESTTGSIQVNGKKILSFDVESTTGSIRLNQDAIYANSVLTSTTGSIHVSLNQDPTSLNVKFETNIGNAHVQKSGYNRIQNSKNKQEFQFGSGETILDVETSTGSFHLE